MSPGSEPGEHQVATRQGTTDEYGYEWVVDDQGTGQWIEMSIVSFEAGSTERNQVPLAGGDLTSGDNPSYPNFNIGRLDFAKMNIELESKFSLGVLSGTLGGGDDGTTLVNHFLTGGGTDFTFANNSDISNEILNDPRFISYAEDFELAVRTYWDKYHTLSYFNGSNIIDNYPHFGGIGENMYLATLVGGVQGVRAEIRMVNSTDVEVNYTFFDVFGAGDNDASRPQYPGLQSMYVLQHYRNTSPSTQNLYKPFFFGINLTR